MSHTNSADFTQAVFSNGAELILVHLEHDDADRAVADAAARGYSYAGCFAVIGGVPKVEIEPHCTTLMTCAGVVFASRLGAHLKELKRVIA